MTKEELLNLKKKISELSEEELKQRDLYLRGLSAGELQGPLTGYASVDKPWLKYYSEEDIKTDIPKMKVYDYLLLNNYNNLDKNALNFFGVKITYKKMFKNIDKISKALVANGVKKGDIVTLAMANTPEMVYLFYALNKIGAICNVIDPRYSSEELKREIDAVDSKIFISLDLCYPNVSKIIDDTKVEKVVYLSATESLPYIVKKIDTIKNKTNIKYNQKCVSWNEFVESSKLVKNDVYSEYEENYPITLVHTGGTTGIPKGVLLTNENFVSMAHMHKVGGLDYSKDDKFLNILPPFIAYCLCNGINMPLSLGLEVTLVPKFDAPEFPELLDKYKPNHVLSGPILWEYVMKSDIKDLSFLKTPVSGGDSLSSETEIKINEYFQSKNCKYKLAQGYGMSEVSSAASFSFERANKTGSVGIPFIKNSISVFDPETLEEKKYGEEGEIWISTPTTMLEYINNNEATNEIKITTKDGKKWIRTSDIGKITEDGNIYVIGRMKRMIVRNGSKIFPSNVENILLQNHDIDSCSIVGVPDDVERTVPVIHIVLNENSSSTHEEIVSFIENKIAESLPSYNIPVKYIFRKELPLTGINKIDYVSLEKEELSDEKIIVIEQKILKK